VLIAGLGNVPDSQPADDVAAIIALVASIVKSEATFAGLCATICAEVGTKSPSFTPPTDGTTLYAAADALDIAVLGALGSK
jgi:hypothetical protein